MDYSQYLKQHFLRSASWQEATAKARRRQLIFQSLQVVLILSVPVILLTEKVFFPALIYGDLVKILVVLIAIVAAALTAYLHVLHQHKLTEQALQELERRFQSMVESAHDAVILADSQGLILFWNKAAKAMFASTSVEANEQPVTLLLGYLLPEHCKGWRERNRAREISAEFDLLVGNHIETLGRRLDGTEFPLELSMATFEAGTETYYVAVMWDIAARKQTEEKDQEQLAQAQKMEAIGQLAGGVAHSFNNILTAILGYSEIMLAQLDPASPIRRYTERIRTGGRRAAELTHQLLAFSRKQILEMKVVDLNSVIQETTQLLQRTLGANIRLIEVLNPQLQQVRVDPGQIGKVIMNLAVNARDAMLPKSGKLIIETENVVIDEAYAKVHPDMLPGPYVQLVVSDTGCGMDAATKARIFEPFFTTKPVGQGTGLGLGLSTVLGIVKQCGGHVWPYSELGRGTSFKVFLPAVMEKATEVQQPVIAQRLAGGSETVLVVEDEGVIRSLVYTVLESCGYTVLEASSGKGALTLMEMQVSPIHLMITDVVMEGLNGVELAQQLAGSHPDMKVLYMSGYTSNVVLTQGVLNAKMAYLQKPFTRHDLANKVREVLDNNY